MILAKMTSEGHADAAPVHGSPRPGEATETLSQVSDITRQSVRRVHEVIHGRTGSSPRPPKHSPRPPNMAFQGKVSGEGLHSRSDESAARSTGLRVDSDGVGAAFSHNGISIDVADA